MNYAELVTFVNDITENNFPTVDMNMLIQQTEQKIYNTVQLPSLRKNSTGVLTAHNQYLSAPSDFLAVYSLAVYPEAGGSYTFLLNKDVNFIREAYPNPASYGTPAHYAIFGPNSAYPTQLTFILGPTPDVIYNAELHYYYYPESIVQRPVLTTSTLVGGSGYNAGTYINVPLTGGSGSGAVATVVVAGGVVTSVTLTQGGCNYVVGNSLSAARANVGGGSGTEFSIAVATVGNTTGETWLGENFDSALLNGTLVQAIRYIKGEPDMVALYQKQYEESMILLKQLGDGKDRQDMYRSGQARVQVL